MLTQPFDKTAPAVLSANDLAKLASDYQQNQHGQGVVISLSSTMEHVKQQHKVINTR